ncbi:hypothetical protein Hanom_Chr03g00256911 [Helianthus anomalus]
MLLYYIKTRITYIANQCNTEISSQSFKNTCNNSEYGMLSTTFSRYIPSGEEISILWLVPICTDNPSTIS